MGIRNITIEARLAYKINCHFRLAWHWLDAIYEISRSCYIMFLNLIADRSPRGPYAVAKCTRQLHKDALSLSGHVLRS